MGTPYLLLSGGIVPMPSSPKKRRRHVRLRRRPPTVDLARVVPQLAPTVLHQIVRRRGLEDSVEIVALATSEQLLRVFDVDLWRIDEPGGEERFDADRFGRWLEVLHEAGPGLGARKIAEMDLDFVSAALSEHLLVLDSTWFLLEASMEEASDDTNPASEGPLDRLYERVLEGEHACEVGGYRVLARRASSWDALVSLLVDLGATHRDFFGRLMGRLARASTEHLDDEGYEFLPGAHETVSGDMAAARDERREAEGYVTPIMATAFLSAARGLRPENLVSPPAQDPVTTAWRRAAERRADVRGETTVERAAWSTPTGSEGRAGDVARFVADLRRAGAAPQATPRLLAGPGADDRLGLVRAQMRHLQEHDGALHGRRMEELGFVANVLVAGASFNGGPFRPPEAARAAAAACNLGLENWPRAWLPHGGSAPPADLLVHYDLVTVFRVGWSVLHERVGLHTGRTLVRILSRLTRDDGGLHADLAELRDGLRKQVEAGTPWRERDNLDALAALDLPTWSVIVGLVDQCPVVPSESGGFEFVAENRQVEWVDRFLGSVPGRWSAD
jgi:hypothetical protein